MSKFRGYWFDFKSTTILAIPIILGQLGHLLIGFTDNIIVGKLGVTALASVAFANNVNSVLLIVSFGLAAAIAPLVAERKGAQDKEGASVIFRQSIVLFAIIGFSFSLLFYLSLPFLEVFQQAQEVTGVARKYLLIICVSYPIILVYHTYKQFLEGIENSLPPMVILFITVVANIFFNWLFIFGNWGMPALGVEGAAIGSVIGRVLGLIIIIFWTHLNKKYQQYSLSLLRFKTHFKIWKKVLRLGVPSASQYFFEVGAFSFAGIMVGWISKEHLAAHQITLNLASFSFMVALGWSFGSSIRVGNALGRKDYNALKIIGFNSISSITIFMFICGLVLISFNQRLPLIYISDINVVEKAAQFLMVAAAFQLFDGTQATSLGLLRGIQDVKIPTLITFVAYWLGAIPFGYLLAFKFSFGAVGVWYGLLIGLCLSSILLNKRFNTICNRLALKNNP